MEDTGGKSARRPGRHLQVEASGPGNAAGVQQRVAGRFGGNLTRRNCCAGPGSKVDAPEASAGPGWKVQEVSRAGAQGVTSKSKLLAREMPRVCSRGLQVDSGTAKLLRARVRGSAPAEGIQTYRRDLEARCGRLLEPRSQPDTACRSFSPRGARLAHRRLASRFGCGAAAEGRVCGAQAQASRFGLPSGHSRRQK